MPQPLPIVLCFSGHDPTGGAGVQADIETLFRLNCHACTVITALTVQDTRNVSQVLPQNPEDFLAQAQKVMDDLPIAAVKIGLLGDAAIASAVGVLLKQLPGIPVVLDPVLAAGGGKELAGERLLEAIRDELLPLTSVATPNSIEARRLAGHAGALAECAQELLRLGCKHALITGTHEIGGDVINRLYAAQGMQEWRWPRLPYTYHGSGCTLASALAGYLAQGMALGEAAERAQAFTWRALEAGVCLGQGQHLPERNLSL
jgi:hydroxymethylpyrimidine/phosphomethylpyrimidine kinase